MATSKILTNPDPKAKKRLTYGELLSSPAHRQALEKQMHDDLQKCMDHADQKVMLLIGHLLELIIHNLVEEGGAV